jgi:hypothetical protein
MPGGAGRISSGAWCRTSQHDQNFGTTRGYFQMYLNNNSLKTLLVICTVAACASILPKLSLPQKLSVYPTNRSQRFRRGFRWRYQEVLLRCHQTGAVSTRYLRAYVVSVRYTVQMQGCGQWSPH